jgi:hypothetical protein
MNYDNHIYKEIIKVLNKKMSLTGERFEEIKKFIKNLLKQQFDVDTILSLLEIDRNYFKKIQKIIVFEYFDKRIEAQTIKTYCCLSDDEFKKMIKKYNN